MIVVVVRNVAVVVKMRREKVCESMNIEKPHNSYSDILQRLVRRYLFKLERQKEEGWSAECYFT